MTQTRIEIEDSTAEADWRASPERAALIAEGLALGLPMEVMNGRLVSGGVGQLEASWQFWLSLGVPPVPEDGPVVYCADYAVAAYKLALLMMTDVEMAGILGICEQTLIDWRKLHPEFSKAIDAGRAE